MALGIIVQAHFRSTSGVSDALLAMLAGFFVYLPIYLLGAMGAGDVKLLMAVGAWTSPSFVLYVAVFAILIGGAYALLDVIWHKRAGAMFENLKRIIWTLVPSGLPREPLDLDRNRKFSFGAAIALAVPSAIFFLGRNWL